MNETSTPKSRWYSKSGQWKIIPLSLLFVGIERSFTGMNLIMCKEIVFGTPILVIGVLVTICGAVLLAGKDNPT
ncbi:hypothetical protein KF913_17090 [Candidatus Obscuribacterales bacterium]|nr:hypothetical protein [Candidatus Obscuribacterales bacterium]